MITTTRLPEQQSVIDEKAELDDKIGKLPDFLANPRTAIDQTEKNRLEKQFSLMEQYSSVLSDRIADFPPTKSTR